jgi:hypothetical protein
MKSRLQCGRDMCQALYLAAGGLEGTPLELFLGKLIFQTTRGEHAHGAYARFEYKGLGRKQTYV